MPDPAETFVDRVVREVGAVAALWRTRRVLLLLVALVGVAYLLSPLVSKYLEQKLPPKSDAAVPVVATSSKTWVYFTYQGMDGGGLKGEFRREGNRWIERNKEHPDGRAWAEITSPSYGRVRLAAANAIIEIDPTDKKIYYTDTGQPGYPNLMIFYEVLVAQ